MEKREKRFLFVPKPGVIVRDPATMKQVAASGEMKPRNSYWLRRLRDGSGTEGVAPTAPAAIDDGTPRTNKRARRDGE